jgi:hypothetical protein
MSQSLVAGRPLARRETRLIDESDARTHRTPTPKAFTRPALRAKSKEAPPVVLRPAKAVLSECARVLTSL